MRRNFVMEKLRFVPMRIEFFETVLKCFTLYQEGPHINVRMVYILWANGQVNRKVKLVREPKS